MYANKLKMKIDQLKSTSWFRRIDLHAEAFEFTKHKHSATKSIENEAMK